MQALAKLSTLRMPVHGATAAGAFQRSAPTGGAAKGMPLKMDKPLSYTPLTSPPVTLTGGICATSGVLGQGGGM